MDNFSSILLKWYHENKRDLPWRDTSDPYKIWLSEIILQQTRVDQGLKYYLKFVNHFPKVNDLANAPQEQVLKLWEGLGYYSRARNLHATAQHITKELNGEFPKYYEDIVKLKGVGPYTAAAISSFAYNEKKAAVDGNVYRVLSRIFHIETPIDSTKGKKEFQALADELIDTKEPGLFNQATMEFGATACTPKQANCTNCCFEHICLAKANNTIDLLPKKEKKIKHKNRYFNYLILQFRDTIAIQNRTAKDIWQGLNEFVNIESDKPKAITELESFSEFENICQKQNYIVKNSFKEYKQTLSHQKIYSNFHLIELKDNKHLSKEYIFIPKKDISKYAFPKTITMFLDDYYSYL